MLYKKVSYEEAKTMFDTLKKLKDYNVFEPFEKYLDNAVKISTEEGIAVYGGLYLVQVKEFGCLLTSDNWN